MANDTQPTETYRIAICKDCHFLLWESGDLVATLAEAKRLESSFPYVKVLAGTRQTYISPAWSSFYGATR